MFVDGIRCPARTPMTSASCWRRTTSSAASTAPRGEGRASSGSVTRSNGVRRPGPSGTLTLERILADLRRSGGLPMSWMERLLRRAVDAADLPLIVLQHEVRRWPSRARFDLALPDEVVREGEREFHDRPGGCGATWSGDNEVKGTGLCDRRRGAQRPEEGVFSPLNCPAVVGLAGGRAPQLVDEQPGLRQLVAGHVAGGLVAERPSSRGLGTTPDRTWTMATTSWPHCSLGRPQTTTSSTSGWATIAASTSSTKIFSPPELIVTESRPSSSMLPSARCRPGRRDRVAHPSITGNVRAVLSGSPR